MIRIFLVLVMTTLSSHLWAALDIASKVELDHSFIDRLWDPQGQDYPVYSLSEVQNLSEDHLIKIYIMGEEGRLELNSSFYEQELARLEMEQGLSEQSMTKLYLAAKSVKSIAAKFKFKSNPSIEEIIESEEKPSIDEIKELLAFRPDLSEFQNGEYQDTLRTFVFCREDRSFPCRMVIQDKRGDWVLDSNGSIFNLPVLAKSSRSIPSHLTNGNTPRGVHLMDSVMPYADQFPLYGANRRVMLDFAKKGTTSALFPSSQHNKLWWKRNSLARDNGRLYFRIHGTGRPNRDESTVYYPHRPTAGCISTREGEYTDITYNDQRLVLDAMMSGLDLVCDYENETLIKGLLYLIEIDTEESAVTYDDLAKFGIQTEDEYWEDVFEDYDWIWDQWW